MKQNEAELVLGEPLVNFHNDGKRLSGITSDNYYVVCDPTLPSLERSKEMLKEYRNHEEA